MVPKLVDVTEKKKTIIEATLAALSQKGIKELRIIDVANNLEMGKSTIYEYFSSKDELIKEALEFFLQEMYISESSEDLSFIKELERVLERFKNTTEEELEQFNIILDSFYQGVKGDFNTLSDVYNDFFAYMKEKIIADQKENKIREDIDPEAVVSWIVGTLDGLGIQILLMPDNQNIDKTIDSFLQAVEEYLHKEEL